MTKRYWLFKSEPNVFSIEDLQQSPAQTSMWDGVRNYQARNFLRDSIRLGDGVLFYHSRVSPMAVVGTARVVRDGYPDPTQFDTASPQHDPRSNPQDPRWFVVDVRFEEAFPRPVTLAELREIPGLEDMMLLQKGSRLSVQPVTAEQWRTIVRLGRGHAAG